MDTFLDKTNGPMMKIFDVIYKLLILNILFILFSLLGLVVFGVFPSWLTLHQIVKREFHDKEKGIQYFSEYKKLFFNNFIPGNILFLFVSVIGFITVLDGIFIFDQYIGADELTFSGILFTIGGLLLSYIVFGMIAMIGTIWGFYDRFNVKDTIKFSFFTVLSSPIFALSSILFLVLSYIIFSILVSAAPFLAVSVPVAGIVLLYGKQYERIFLIKRKDGYSYFNFRYVQDFSLFVDVLNSILPSETMYINDGAFRATLKQENVDLKSSIVVLDNSKRVVGFMIVIQTANEGVIEFLVVKKGFQQQGIGSNMLHVLLDKKEYNVLKCNTNKKMYHQSLESLPNYRLFCKKNGFNEIEKDLYMLDL